MSQFEYDNKSFVAISIITMVLLTLSLWIIISNIIRHCRAKYASIRKRSIIILFVLEIISSILLIVSLWIYPYCEPILIFVVVWINLVLFFVFLVLNETLMLYSSKFAREHPQVLDEIAQKADDKYKEWTQNHMNMMKQRVYPFQEITGLKRFQTAYVYVALWYFLEGSGRTCICCRRKISTYRQAYRFHLYRNMVPMILYFLLVPLSNIAEYTLVSMIDWRMLMLRQHSAAFAE